MKVYNWDAFTCCSGTYIQNVADYHNLIYFKDADGLYVNLFLPSDVRWKTPGGEMHLTQETKYPDQGAATLTVRAAVSAPVALHFRVPSWTTGFAAAVDGAPVA